jgi:nuclear transport factor 2 (NTF2) superfamily protein
VIFSIVEEQRSPYFKLKTDKKDERVAEEGRKKEEMAKLAPSCSSCWAMYQLRAVLLKGREALQEYEQLRVHLNLLPMYEPRT